MIIDYIDFCKNRKPDKPLRKVSRYDLNPFASARSVTDIGY